MNTLEARGGSPAGAFRRLTRYQIIVSIADGNEPSSPARRFWARPVKRRSAHCV